MCHPKSYPIKTLVMTSRVAPIGIHNPRSHSFFYCLLLVRATPSSDTELVQAHTTQQGNHLLWCLVWAPSCCTCGWFCCHFSSTLKHSVSWRQLQSHHHHIDIHWSQQLHTLKSKRIPRENEIHHVRRAVTPFGSTPGTTARTGRR
jgi:hypothetical protein